MQKKCFKCKKTKPIEMFYRHPQMGDGHLGKCKACTKRDVNERYADPESRKRIAAYEFHRSKTEHRKNLKKIYQIKRRQNHPGKTKCNTWVSRAVRDGRLNRLPCEVCGKKKSEAHHDDYRKPQQVRWLCFKHHREVAHGQKCVDPRIAKAKE